MPLRSFDDLFAAADQAAAETPVVVAGGADDTVLTALAEAGRRRWVRPVLAGPESALRRLADEQGIDLSGCEIIAADAHPEVAAVAALRSGRAKWLMKGQVSTPDLMKAVLDRSQGLRTDRTIGQVVLMEIPRDARRFLLTDTGVTTAPTIAQRQSLLRDMAEIARRLGAVPPRLAIVSATEKPTDALPDTHEAVALAEWVAAGHVGDALAAGPLSFDLAYDPRAATRKGVSSEVVGRADGLLFPNLLAANLTVKAIMYTADCRFGGLLTGCASPVVFMSRADDVPTRLRSLAFAAAATTPE